MKAVTSFRYSHWGPTSKYTTRKNRLILKRITPFLLLSLFFAFWLMYTLIAGTEITIATKLILYPFLLINLALADFTLWNYLEGKKLWLTWILESIATAIIIYWLL